MPTCTTSATSGTSSQKQLNIEDHIMTWLKCAKFQSSKQLRKQLSGTKNVVGYRVQHVKHQRVMMQNTSLTVNILTFYHYILPFPKQFVILHTQDLRLGLKGKQQDIQLLKDYSAFSLCMLCTFSFNIHIAIQFVTMISCSCAHMVTPHIHRQIKRLLLFSSIPLLPYCLSHNQGSSFTFQL